MRSEKEKWSEIREAGRGDYSGGLWRGDVRLAGREVKRANSEV